MKYAAYRHATVFLIAFFLSTGSGQTQGQTVTHGTPRADLGISYEEALRTFAATLEFSDPEADPDGGLWYQGLAPNQALGISFRVRNGMLIKLVASGSLLTKSKRAHTFALVKDVLDYFFPDWVDKDRWIAYSTSKAERTRKPVDTVRNNITIRAAVISIPHHKLILVTLN